MKAQITKKTLSQIITQARALGAFEKKKLATEKTIACEFEKPDGKRVFISLPCRLIDWLKDFDAPPTVEISVGKQVVEQWVKPLHKEARIIKTVTAGFIVRANVSEGGRTSRLSCAVKRLKTPLQNSVLLRIEADGKLVCVERVAKLSRVKAWSYGKLTNLLVFRSHSCGVFAIGKAQREWKAFFVPNGEQGSAGLGRVACRKVTDAEAVEFANAFADKHSEVIEKTIKEGKMTELAKETERQGLEGERVKNEKEGIVCESKEVKPTRAKRSPVMPAPSPVVESVAVVESVPAPIPPAMESAVTPSGGISEEKTETATLCFPSRLLAQSFAIQWARATLRGHSISASKPTGQTSVTVYDVKEREKPLIESIITGLGAEVAHPSVKISEPCQPIASNPPPSPIESVIVATVDRPSVATGPLKRDHPSPYPPTAEYRLKREAERAFACFAWLAWSTAPSLKPIPIHLPPPRPPKRAAQRDQVRSHAATFATARRQCPTLPGARTNAPPSLDLPCRRHFRPHLPLGELRSVAS